MNYHRVEVEIVTKNIDSIKIAEFLGLERESTRKESYKLENEYLDQYVYVKFNSNDIINK